MIVGACGFGSTGSSVVTDYLREFDSVTVKDDFEFTWVPKVDGLIDLERAVMNPHFRTSDSSVAIRRFEKLVKRLALTYEIHGLPRDDFEKMIEAFIDAITTVKWVGYSNENKSENLSVRFADYFMRRKVIPKLERKAGHQLSCWPLREVRVSVHPDNFYVEAQKLVDTMLGRMGMNTNGIIALDQPFSGNNPQACFPFFRDPYAVVVDRDPRDNYVFARTKLLGRNHFMAVEPVEDFIAYYRALRKDQPYLRSDDRVMILKFEDMVYEYEDTTAKLRAFLKLPENPRPKSVFDPALSVANTQVFLRFPEFAEDVKKIERELPDYLFDYSRYPTPDPKGKMFFGKSPLNPGKPRK